MPSANYGTRRVPTTLKLNNLLLRGHLALRIPVSMFVESFDFVQMENFRLDRETEIRTIPQPFEPQRTLFRPFQVT